LDADRYINNGQYHKALPLLMAILEDYSPMSIIDSAAILDEIILCYYDIKDLKNTLKTYNSLCRMRIRNKNIKNKWFQVYPSNIYYNLGLYQEALAQQVKEKINFSKNKGTLASFYNNRGLYWTKAGDYDSAHACFQRALALIKEKNPYGESFIALIKGNIAQVYIHENKFKEAVPLLKNDVNESKKNKNILNIAINFIELSTCYNALNQPANSSRYLDSFAAIRSEKIDPDLKLRFLKCKSDLYFDLSQKDSALNYLKLYLDEKEVIEREKNNLALYNIKVSQDVFQLQSEIKDKRKEIEIEHNLGVHERALKQTYLYALLVVILLLGIILYLTFKLNRRRKLLESNNKKITNQNRTIHKSLNEKEILIKEIHHRVKNNLQVISSLLNLQLNSTENEKAKEALSDAHGRILSMALLHQQLMIKNEQSVVELSEFIKSLGKSLESTLISPEKPITIEYSLHSIFLPIDIASPVCLIANEVLVNSIKHAFTNKTNCKIEISLTQTEQGIELRISDNGNGFNVEEQRSKGMSLGLEIIDTVADQLSAHYSFENKNGTTFTLKLPLQKK
jgi:two-component system, sensor histidine kinase PdtaS